ncbi:putative ATPase [Micromonospora profundi]|uniref:AAA family ATPase n=1 Tax=Micromonospora profundi TaxID=1420889 RepID=UPI00143C0A4E|nr:AAA family ATPase [Micromonospora profundi]NJC10520.1 putative ATPase [Micromonospora profundi]
MPAQIKVRNFANVRSADVSLGDLAVFLGPNNSGKSTLATVIYAACRVKPTGGIGLGQGRRLQDPRAIRLLANYGMPPDFDGRSLDKLARQLREALLSWERHDKGQGRSGSSVSLPTRMGHLLTRPMIATLRNYCQVFVTELERCFGDTLDEFLADGKRETIITLAHDDDWHASITIRKGKPSFEIDVSEPSEADLNAIIDGFFRSRRSDHGLWRQVTQRHPYGLLQEVYSEILRYYFRNFPNLAYYLPAARSGMLHSHRALAAALIRQSAFVGIQDFAVPKLPGVVTDFLSQLLELSPRRTTTYEETARFLEGEILHGRINLAPQAPTAPEIMFAEGASVYALHRTSSMVSELAPVILFLRHVLRRGDLLIIEEPESHLHPASQVKFAQAIALMINQGAKVIITTHSDYFLNQLNNLIKLHTLATARDEQPSNSPSIDPHSVEAYLVNPGPDGSNIEHLTVDPSSGISDAEFAEVADWLYNESAAIARDLNDAKS